MIKSIDINCDMGESFGNWNMGNDFAMMGQITTANVACGFHAGDPLTMLNTIEKAKKYNVLVGSHPGLPDLMGFGRRAMNISADDAYAYTIYQTGALQAALKVHGMTLHHVKPHGAFYSILKTDEVLAAAVADAISQLSDKPMLYWPAPTDAAMPAAARKKGIRVVGEIYPDLHYAPDGALIIQREKHETDITFATDQVERYIETNQVQAIDGSLITLDAESICIHGDGPNAVEVSLAINEAIKKMSCLPSAIID
jgi:5-oxoprolinase (ATP-hydrolysing) subunit A